MAFKVFTSSVSVRELTLDLGSSRHPVKVCSYCTSVTAGCRIQAITPVLAESAMWCAMKAVIHTADHALHTGVGHTHHYCDVCITQWYNYLDHLHKARFWNEWEIPGYVLADGIGEEAANEGAVNSENGVQVHHMPRVPPKILITYFHYSYVKS